MAPSSSRYLRILEDIFLTRHRKGATEVPFTRDDLVATAEKLKIERPKNLGDIVYSYRYRSDLPNSMQSKAPRGKQWVIKGDGRARYKFVAQAEAQILPNALLASTKIPDATPGVIARWALGDEQALLAKLRYNRLIDIFSGVVCYSLQNHLRTSVPGLGQVETDEVYVGIDRSGAQYVFPVQAKGGNDRISIVQIEQDIGLCAARFPLLVCRPIAAQFVGPDEIALFDFEEQQGEIRLRSEKHYRLVPEDDVADDDLERYGRDAIS